MITEFDTIDGSTGITVSAVDFSLCITQDGSIYIPSNPKLFNNIGDLIHSWEEYHENSILFSTLMESGVYNWMVKHDGAYLTCRPEGEI